MFQIRGLSGRVDQQKNYANLRALVRFVSVLSLVSALSIQNSAAATIAGTRIPNTARIAFTANGAAATGVSNTATLIVAEILNIDLNSPTNTVSVTPGAPSIFGFTITNQGNGREAFVLEGRIGGDPAQVEGFALDRDGDGRFDPAIDLAIAPGAATPMLEPGATVAVLAIIREAAVGTLTVRSFAVTGSGVPGTGFPGQGDGGGDALVGATTAADELSVTLTSGDGPGSNDLAVIKSQLVTAPDGSNRPIRGAVITYTIESRFTGSGTALAVLLSDPLPAGTVYVPGSLRLDGLVLTDTTDGDAGSFDGGTVRAALGDVPAPASRIFQFQAKIQ